jgi:hypothetical protein
MENLFIALPFREHHVELKRYRHKYLRKSQNINTPLPGIDVDHYLYSNWANNPPAPQAGCF